MNGPEDGRNEVWTKPEEEKRKDKYNKRINLDSKDRITEADER